MAGLSLIQIKKPTYSSHEGRGVNRIKIHREGDYSPHLHGNWGTKRPTTAMPPTNCICFYTKDSISGGSAGFHYQGDLRILEGLRLNLRAAAVGKLWLTLLPLSPPPSPLSVTIHTMLSFNTVYFITSVIRYLCYATIDVTTHPLIGHPYMISLSTGMYVTTF